jgi:hypothetical protein
VRHLLHFGVGVILTQYQPYSSPVWLLANIDELFHSRNPMHQYRDTQNHVVLRIILVKLFAVRFMLDGENINPESTPGDMDLEDNDQIDCFLAQVGGGGRIL